MNLITGGRLPILSLVFVLGFQGYALHAESLSWEIENRESASTGIASTQPDSPDGEWEYITQSGDTLEIVASRFQVRLSDIHSPSIYSPEQLLDPGQILYIRRTRVEASQVSRILPDSEIVYSPDAANFDTHEYIATTRGFLSSHQEYMRSTGYTDAADIIHRVAVENSIHPRLLLALLEFQCGCVTGPLDENLEIDHLMGVSDPLLKGLYRQLGWTANQLSLGYYGWRQGILHSLVLEDGSVIALDPDLNAGSVAVAYLFTHLIEPQAWERTMDPERGFTRLYHDMFAGYDTAGISDQELFLPGLAQPDMILPFQVGREWSFTSGPHEAWETEGAWAALDFAPAAERFGCEPSSAWVLAVADGLVVRSENNALVLDLDKDGFEGTGWAVLYMHLADFQQAVEGTFVERGAPLGHPSCDGGPADGTHVHIARKFNGEWIAADGPLPFVMDGWVTHAGYRPYEGSLKRGNQLVVANALSPAAAFIMRSPQDELLNLKVSRDFWWEEELQIKLGK